MRLFVIEAIFLVRSRSRSRSRSGRVSMLEREQEGMDGREEGKDKEEI